MANERLREAFGAAGRHYDPIDSSSLYSPEDGTEGHVDVTPELRFSWTYTSVGRIALPIGVNHDIYHRTQDGEFALTVIQAVPTQVTTLSRVQMRENIWRQAASRALDATDYDAGPVRLGSYADMDVMVENVCTNTCEQIIWLDAPSVEDCTAISGEEVTMLVWRIEDGVKERSLCLPNFVAHD